MGWRLECPVCGRYGVHRYDRATSHHVFECLMCGFTLHAITPADLKENLRVLSDKYRTAELLGK